jgi:ubiquinone biosynthesis protein Coq4
MPRFKHRTDWQKDDLYELMADRETLKNMPEGSIGRVYWEFTEADNYRPEYIVNRIPEGKLRDEARAFSRHTFDSHDLWHAALGLSKFPRDEVALNFIIHWQTRIPSVGVSMWVGYLAGVRVSGFWEATMGIVDAWRLTRRKDYPDLVGISWTEKIHEQSIGDFHASAEAAKQRYRKRRKKNASTT